MGSADPFWAAVPVIPFPLANYHREPYRGFEILPGGALGYFSGGYVPPGTPNWQPVLKKNCPKIDTPF